MDSNENTSHILAEVSSVVEARFAHFNDLAHGWEHVQRVYYLAIQLAKQEQAAIFIVGMAALLNDLGRTVSIPMRTHAERSAVLATEILAPYNLSNGTQNAILHAVLAHSYRRGAAPETLEARVLYDADRLDSLGATGVMRWAMTTKRKQWPEMRTYDPGDPFAAKRVPNDKQFLLDRFFTKFLKLAETMKTATGLAMAQRRITFMGLFLQELQGDLTESMPGPPEETAKQEAERARVHAQKQRHHGNEKG